MSDPHWMQGDSSAMMRLLPDESVDLVLTSPPFLALRSYLPDGHPNKHLEMGSEPDPATFIDALLAWTAECGRVLADHGSLCVELGDTYSGGGGPDAKNPDAGQSVGGRTGDGWPLAKSLALIPEAYRMSLAYGRNIITGEPSPAGLWRIRNVVRWARPNPPVGALGDKFRPATSEMVIACRSDRRWFDLDAVRHAPKYPDDIREEGSAGYRGITEGGARTVHTPSHPAGAPPLDWWKISPKGYAGAHYAVWPSELCVKPIKAMSPREVCRECGEPRRRVVDVEPSPNEGNWYHQGQDGGSATGGTFRTVRKSTTLGWSDCGHDNYRPGLVLDPFAGTGTTLAVAHGHGRDAIGIDIDERSAELARERVGPLFLEVVGLADGLRV